MANLSFTAPTDEELEAFVKPYIESGRNVESLKAIWKRCASMPGLLTAKFDQEKGQFISSTGRVIPSHVVEANIKRLSDCMADELVKLSDKFSDGEISLQTFYDQSQKHLRDNLLLSSLVAYGGLPFIQELITPPKPRPGQLPGRNVPAVTNKQSIAHTIWNIIKNQFYYFRGIGRDIASGKLFSKKRLAFRVRNYAQALRAAYWNVNRQFQREILGKKEERRVLGVNEKHCLDCPTFATLGWQPIGTLPEIGDKSACNVYCKCKFEYR